MIVGLTAGVLGFCSLCQPVFSLEEACPVGITGGVASSASSNNATPNSAAPNGAPKVAAAMGSGDSSGPATDDLGRLNSRFRQDYADAKRQIREKLGPIVVLNGDSVVLYRGKDRLEEHMTPELYTLDKSVDHIPLTIFVVLTNATGASFDQETREKLIDLKEFVSKATDEVYKSTVPGLELGRQREIIEKSTSFIDEVLLAGQVSETRLRGFTRMIAPLTLKNVDQATAKSLSRVDEIVQKWRKEMTATEWEQLYVVVVSGHMPRAQNSFMQYFQKLLHQKREGERIVYFEGTAEDRQALDLLVTHILDRRIAIDFYKDPWRMHRDLLSDGAKKYLKKHPPVSK